MRRIYHNQKCKVIPRVIVNYAVAISRSKYPLLRFTNKIEFLCGYNIIKGANKKSLQIAGLNTNEHSHWQVTFALI